MRFLTGVLLHAAHRSVARAAPSQWRSRTVERCLPSDWLDEEDLSVVKRASPFLAALGLIAGQLLIATGAVSAASPEFFTAALSGAQNVPPMTTSASGSATFVIDPTGTTVSTRSATPAERRGVRLAYPSGRRRHEWRCAPPDGRPKPDDRCADVCRLRRYWGVTTFAGRLAAIRAGGTYVNPTPQTRAGRYEEQVTTAAHQPVYTITADRAAAVPQGHLWSFNDYFHAPPR
jgi:hypothetical protein